MRSRRLVLVLLVLAGCSTSTRVVRLEAGRGEPIIFVPRQELAEPVKLDAREVSQTLAQLGREVRLPANPQEAARRLFELSERSGWFQYEPRSKRLVPVGSGGVIEEDRSAIGSELTRLYLDWCGRQGTPGDCRRLLSGSPSITGDGRYALAMAFAKGAVLDEMKDALKGMANPDAVLSAVLWTCTTYLILLTVPEPVSKGIAAVLTGALIAWVGFDTFWSLIVGFKQLVEEADHATTFEELRRAGERYGRVMGRNAARAFVMLATAAIGCTAAELATKVPMLPGAAQAAMQARLQLGIHLAGMGEVSAVAVSANAVTVSLASGAALAVAMSGHDGPESPLSATGGGSQAMRPAPAKQGQIIALGLEDHLDEFAKSIGGRTWKDWARADPTRWKSAFTEVMSNPSNRVSFNLTGVDDPWRAVARAAAGRGGATDWELLQIKSNPSWWNRITFFRDGKVVPNPFLE